MKQNIFFKSTLRQPLRTGLLLVLTALVAFAFVGRVAEYLLVDQAVQQAGSAYRTVAALTSEEYEVDVGAAVEILQQSQYVKTINTPWNARLVAQDIYNETLGRTPSYRYGTNGPVDQLGRDVFFVGELTDAGETTWGGYRYTFTVRRVLAGYPDYIEEGESVTLYSLRSAEEDFTHTNAYSMGITSGANPAASALQLATAEEMADLYASMQVGGCYLMRGSFDLYDPTLAALGQTSYAVWSATASHAFALRRLNGSTESPVWVLPLESAEALDLTDPQLADIRAELELVDGNERALLAYFVQDVSAMPEAQEASRELYLAEGRWVNAADTENQNAVCMIHRQLAEKRGLTVGDTLDVTLYDCGWQSVYLPSQREKLAACQSSTLSLTIVGIYEDADTNEYDVGSLEEKRWAWVYLPASLLPQGYSVRTDLSDATTYLNGSESGGISFELNSPADQAAFLAESKDALAALGFQCVFVESNWEAFQTTAQSMTRAARFNLAVYLAVLAATLALVVFVYLHTRRKELTIARALGMPKGRCLRQMEGPLLLLGAVGVCAGGAAGWYYTLQNAAETMDALLSLTETDAQFTLPVQTLCALCVAVCGLLAVLSLAAVLHAVNRPVTRLLQGNAARPEAKKQTPQPAPGEEQGQESAAAQPVQASPTAAAQPAAEKLETAGSAARIASSEKKSEKMKRSGRAGAGQMLRFARRQILRAPGKTLLAAALAAAFTLCLAAVRGSIANSGQELIRLSRSIEVEVNVTREADVLASGSYIDKSVVTALEQSGFIGREYLEGLEQGQFSLYEGDATNSAATASMAAARSATLHSFGDADLYLSRNALAGGVKITYADGWDASLFAEDWSAQTQAQLLPVVLEQQWMDTYGVQLGDTVALALAGKSSGHVYVVAGSYTGTLSGAAGDAMNVLVPSALLEGLKGANMKYSVATFWVDPTRNLELDEFKAVLDKALDLQNARGDYYQLRALVWDEQLRNTLEPIQDSIALMQLLYPVLLALSALIAAAVAALLAQLSAKDAAILRVLGTTRRRSWGILCLQAAVPCVLGLALGVAAVYAGLPAARAQLGAALGCAALYLAAALVGAAISAAATLRRNPLELLQVKE